MGIRKRGLHNTNTLHYRAFSYLVQLRGNAATEIGAVGGTSTPASDEGDNILGGSGTGRAQPAGGQSVCVYLNDNATTAAQDFTVHFEGYDQNGLWATESLRCTASGGSATMVAMTGGTDEYILQTTRAWSLITSVVLEIHAALLDADSIGVGFVNNTTGMKPRIGIQGKASRVEDILAVMSTLNGTNSASSASIPNGVQAVEAFDVNNQTFRISNAAANGTSRLLEVFLHPEGVLR